MRRCLRTYKQKLIIFPNRRKPTYFFIVTFIHKRLVKGTELTLEATMQLSNLIGDLFTSNLL